MPEHLVMKNAFAVSRQGIVAYFAWMLKGKKMPQISFPL